jgi:hypothetical protein
MKNEIVKNEMSSQLRLPLQVAPVNRTLAATALSGQKGVVPSGWFDDIVKVVGPIAGQVLPGLLSSI